MVETPNILIIRLTAIGDVILTLPAVSQLRQNFPTAKISFLTTQENVSLLRGFAEVNETIAIDRATLRSRNLFRIGAELFRLMRRLHSGNFSLAVDLQGNGESAWITRLTGASQRWGAVHQLPRGWVFTRTIERNSERHAADMHLELLRHCGLKIGTLRNEFALPSEALAEAQSFLAAHNISPVKPLMVVQPFTSSPHKNWPLENYLALAHHWQARGWQILFSGGPGDRGALDPAETAGFTISAGVPLLVSGGLMQIAGLIVGGDTGMLHLAVALQKRVVMLMNHNRPGRPHPFLHPEWSLLPPIDRKITSIQLDAVIAACEDAVVKKA